ncbi:MAG: response regulator [Deltaproteobacteria bacterium]|nr:response regulator [Deltaproteobacteria bacterium]
MARILLVDDEPDMLALLRTVIRARTEHEVLQTNNPLEVSEILDRAPVDVVVTDLKMPGMDGLDLLAQVHARDPDIAVLVITAYGSEESASEALRRGAADFITKPFRKEQILLALDKALRFQALVRQNRELRRQVEGGSGGNKDP